MCGIAGALGLGRGLDDGAAAVVERMTGALRRRGPDARRVLAGRDAVLGNSRLRVLDLSERADLPMVSADGGAALCYNGMVTNFEALRLERLDPAGGPARTGSDTEVLLRLYEENGIGFVGELSGMFAFCLHDRTRRKAFLVRDFYGLRPLFYARQGATLWFASEIKALLDVPGLDRTLDREALWHYFSLGYIPGERTPFRAIRELREGCLIEADLATGRLEFRRHHETRFGPGTTASLEDAVAELRETLVDSVRRSLVADAPVGMTLSGGVDTSGLLAIAKHLGRASSLHTYSIVMDESSFDESSYQKTMVEFARPIHHEVRVGPEQVANALDATVAALDEPLVNGAAAPMLLLAREARKEVSVLLSGEGGDEIFNAYETHRAYKARALYRRLVPGPARALVRMAADALPCSYRKLSFDFLAKRFTGGAELEVAEAHFHWRHVLGEDEKLRLLDAPAGARTPTADLFTDYYRSLDAADPLDRISLLDLHYYFVDDLMVKNDRTLAANGLEGRYPYMDRPVVERAAAIPASLRLNGFRGRFVQKRALEPFLPAPILRRSNMGLETPHSLWLLGPLRAWAEAQLTREAVESTGLLRHEAVRALWEEHLARRRDNGRPLWAVINFLRWHRMFVRDGDYRRFLA